MKLKKELTYPSLLIVFLMMFSLFIVYALLPSIMQLFNEFSIEPSLITRFMFMLSLIHIFYNPQAFKNFEVGKITLNGEEALAFSRERYSFEDGDKERGRNQMRVITGIINKVLSPAIISNYSELMDKLHVSFQTNMSDEQIISLVRMQLDDMSPWTIQQQSVNGNGQTLYSPIYGSDLYMMVPDCLLYTSWY